MIIITQVDEEIKTERIPDFIAPIIFNEYIQSAIQSNQTVKIECIRSDAAFLRFFNYSWAAIHPEDIEVVSNDNGNL